MKHITSIILLHAFAYPCYGFILGKTPFRIIETSKIASAVDDDIVPDSTRIYFDIAIDDEEVGRLVFNLGPEPYLLPKHTENIIKLATGEQRSVDPLCSYVKCAFQHSPQYVEGYPQYRWGHVVQGKGRNAVGRPTDRITDPENMRRCKHSVYGSEYYGQKYEDLLGYAPNDLGGMGSDDGVVLTVPLVGAYRGSTSFSIVRVGESPQEWKERLLGNSAVLGYLESSSMNTLHTLARQTKAPPMIIRSGKL